MTIVSILPFFMNLGSLKLSFFSCSLVFILGCWFTYNSFKLYSNVDDYSAKKINVFFINLFAFITNTICD